MRGGVWGFVGRKGVRECAGRCPGFFWKEGCGGVREEVSVFFVLSRLCRSARRGLQIFVGSKGVQECPGRHLEMCWEEGCVGVSGEVSGVALEGRV